VEQNRRPRYESMKLCHLIFDKDAKNMIANRQPLSTNVDGKTRYLHEEN
jgi:hypothetical protein